MSFPAHSLRNRCFAQISAALLIALGGISLAGWWAHNEALRSIIPGSSPLKPNIAAGFVLCGLALLALAWQRLPRASQIFAGAATLVVIALSSLTLIEHFSTCEFRIDEFLVRPFPSSAGASHPGRMLPTTAFCFLLSGIALLAQARLLPRRLRSTLVGALSACLVIIGVVAMGGLLLELTLGAKWNLLGMSVSGVTAAIGFVILGGGLFALLQSKGELNWSIGLFGTVGFGAGILLVVLTAGAGFTFAREMVETNKRVSHRDEVLQGLQEVVTQVTELSSSERLYALVGDEGLLKERERTRGALTQNVAHIRSLVADNSKQQNRLSRLEPLIASRLDWEEKVIVVRRMKGLPAMEAMVGNGPGLLLSEQIFDSLKEMENEEHRLLAGDRNRAEMASTATFLLLPLGLFLSIAVLSFGVFFLNSGAAEEIQAQRALRQSEERYRSLFENNPNPMWIFDLETLSFLAVNTAAMQLYGYSSEEFLAMTIREIRPAEDVPDLLEDLSRSEDATVKRTQWRHRKKDGSLIDVEITPREIEWFGHRAKLVLVNDITERNQAEVARRQAEEQYRSIVENAVEGVFQSTPEGKYLSVNPALARIYGYFSPEGLMKSVIDIGRDIFVDPKRRNEFKQMIETQGYVKRFEYEARRRSGAKIWISENARVVLDSQGAVSHYEGTVEDITERKRAENALRTSEAHLQTVVEHLDEGVIVSSLNGTLLHWNRAALEIHGYKSLTEGLRSLHEFLDTFQLFTLDGVRVPLAEWPLARVVRGENLHDVELRVRNVKAGWERIFNYGGTRVNDANGHPLLAIATVSDVTERKKAAERLLEQTDIINRAHDAIIIRNVHDEAVTFWNKGAEALYGWTAEEALGKPVTELIFVDLKEREAPLTQLLSSGDYQGGLRQTAKGGKEIFANCHATLIRGPNGEPRSVLHINNDVTEEKRLGMQLLRAQRLETIGTLASGIAHDLNNILTPILMCAEMLEEGDAKGRQNAIAIIEQSARRGASIVKQVLTFARGIEGKRVLIKPSHLIEEMIDIARKTFPKGITISARYPEELWSIQGDPTQLHQVLLNLSVNARDAMADVGSLTLSAEDFTADEHFVAMTPNAKVGPYLVLSVADSGGGMPRDMIDKIFDPFFTTKEVGKGTGLGLSTVLGIVKSHGGFVSVYSEVGKGTTFKIFLPATASDEEVEKATAPRRTIHGNGEQILVVDDEPSILEMARIIFEKHHYRVISAKNGKEALDVFAKQKDALGGVLTDVAMPNMDGISLVREIRKLKPEMPVIASTGQGDDTGMQELAALGVTNFLTKPYNIDKLLSTVQASLEGRKA